jgi:hypothetical protein
MRLTLANIFRHISYSDKLHTRYHQAQPQFHHQALLTPKMLISPKAIVYEFRKIAEFINRNALIDLVENRY